MSNTNDEINAAVEAAINPEIVEDNNGNENENENENRNGLFDLDEGSKRELKRVCVEASVVGLSLVILGIVLFTLLKAFDYEPFKEYNNNAMIFIFLLGFITHVVYEKTGWNYKFCKAILDN